MNNRGGRMYPYAVEHELDGSGDRLLNGMGGPVLKLAGWLKKCTGEKSKSGK
jgi:hypothetical protein